MLRKPLVNQSDRNHQPLHRKLRLFGPIVLILCVLDPILIFVSNHQRSLIFNVAVLSQVLAGGLVCYMIARFNRSFAQPLFRLQSDLMESQRGEFSLRSSLDDDMDIQLLQLGFNEMAAKIEQTVGDLKKTDQLKTDSVSTISHELRTPLTSITGYVKLLVNGDAGPITDAQKDFLKIISTNVDRLNVLVSEILDLEAIESGEIKLAKEPQDLGSILKECCETFQVVAAQKDLEILCRVPENLKPIVGDRARLVQVFLNLISNAIKYTEKGYVKIEVEQNDLAVVIRVQDSGPGMTHDQVGLLFQKYYRAHSTSLEGGTGLGLSIARGWVEAHGGKIQVESQLDRGSLFTVTLPSMPLDSTAYLFRSGFEGSTVDLK